MRLFCYYGIVLAGHAACHVSGYLKIRGENYGKGFMESLKKNGDFRQVYKSQNSRANRYLVMYVKPNDLEYNRIGISVSKKIGNSVVRHRIKRLIKESYRLHETEFEGGSDIVVVARRSADGASYQMIETALLGLMKSHKLQKHERRKGSDGKAGDDCSNKIL